MQLLVVCVEFSNEGPPPSVSTLVISARSSDIIRAEPDWPKARPFLPDSDGQELAYDLAARNGQQATAARRTNPSA
jgi:hypothetical protein